jgi:hypothetical protein
LLVSSRCGATRKPVPNGTNPPVPLTADASDGSSHLGTAREGGHRLKFVVLVDDPLEHDLGGHRLLDGAHERCRWDLPRLHEPADFFLSPPAAMPSPG